MRPEPPSLRAGTGQIAWGRLCLLSLPVAAFAFVEKCSGTALTFTLQEHLDNPAWILFLGSMSSLFAVVIAPWAAFKSDDRQSRLGGRKTLMTVGFVMLAVSMVLIPAAGNLVLLVGLILIYQFSVDLGYTGPWKPLYFDQVPQSQRGRGMILNRYAAIGARFIFMFFLIGRFDEEIGFKKAATALSSRRWATLTGEQVIYYAGAALVLLSLGILLGCVREKPHPAGPPSRPKPRLRHYLKQIVTVRRNRLMCLLVISSVLMSTKLMNLRPLLITEQFGYSKQAFGNMHAMTMLVNTMLILPLLVLVIDRVDKFKIFSVCILLSTLHPAVYWVYVKYFAPNGIPPVSMIIAFNIADSAFDRTALLALWPFLFDLVDPDKKGLFNSMFLVAAGLVKFVNTNLMGLSMPWIAGFFGRGTSTDYMACYLYILAVGLIGCLGTLYFARHRHELTGPQADGPACTRGSSMRSGRGCGCC